MQVLLLKWVILDWAAGPAFLLSALIRKATYYHAPAKLREWPT